jgi:hypothetical protein
MDLGGRVSEPPAKPTADDIVQLGHLLDLADQHGDILEKVLAAYRELKGLPE